MIHRLVTLAALSAGILAFGCAPSRFELPRSGLAPRTAAPREVDSPAYTRLTDPLPWWS